MYVCVCILCMYVCMYVAYVCSTTEHYDDWTILKSVRALQDSSREIV